MRPGDVYGAARVVRRALRESLAAQRQTDEWRRHHVNVSEKAIIRLAPGSRLLIGVGSTIGPFTVLDLTDDPNSNGTDIVHARLEIGRRTAINEFNNIRAAGGTILIGDNCLLSQYVTVVASNHDTTASGPMRDAPWSRERTGVEIGDDVWIGASAVVLPGVRLGSGSVVAAGAVVTRDVPQGVIVGGVPARVLGYRHETAKRSQP